MGQRQSLLFKAGSEKGDFAHLRIANDPPKPHDQALIRNIISGIDEEIYDLDKAIATLEDGLKKLKVKHATQLKIRTDYASLVSPLRSLPMEIFGEIFLYSTAESISSRLTASHVCRLWRDAALSTSELWSTIDGSFPSSSEHLQEYIRTCVHRARSRPLILVRDAYQFVDYDALPFVLDATQNCSWKEFTWDPLAVIYFRPVVEALGSASLDTLESLTLGCRRPFGEVPVSLSRPSLDMVPFSSRLSRLTISLWTTLDSATLSVPWSQLTQLTISCPESDDSTILGILRQCSVIEEFAFESSRIGTPYPADKAPLHLPRLSKLHLTGDPQLFDRLAHVLVTPLLRELILDTSHFFELGTELNLKKYLLACAKTLTHLWISGISMLDVKDTITKLDLLEELILVCNDGVDGDSFRSLDIWPHNYGNDVEVYNIPLPYLRALKIICTVRPEIQDTFIEIIYSRWWPWSDGDSTKSRPVARLQHASLQQSAEEDRMMRGRDVELFKQQGLDLNMLTPAGDHDVQPDFVLSPRRTWNIG